MVESSKTGGGRYALLRSRGLRETDYIRNGYLGRGEAHEQGCALRCLAKA